MRLTTREQNRLTQLCEKAGVAVLRPMYRELLVVQSDGYAQLKAVLLDANISSDLRLSWLHQVVDETESKWQELARRNNFPVMQSDALDDLCEAERAEYAVKP